MMMREHGDGYEWLIDTLQQNHSPHIKQHGSNAICLFNFLATHDCFSYACCPTKIYNVFWQIFTQKKGLACNYLVVTKCLIEVLAYTP
jgi:hypothetical protein